MVEADDARFDVAAVLFVDAGFADLRIWGHDDFFTCERDQDAVAFDRLRDVGDGLHGREIGAGEKTSDRNGSLKIGSFASARMSAGWHQLEH